MLVEKIRANLGSSESASIHETTNTHDDPPLAAMLGLQEATIPASQSLGLQFADDHKGKHFVSHVSETSPLVGRISEGGHIEKVRTPDTGTSHSADFSAQEIYIVLTSLTGEPRTLTYANVGRRPSARRFTSPSKGDLLAAVALVPGAPTRAASEAAARDANEAAARAAIGASPASRRTEEGAGGTIMGMPVTAESKRRASSIALNSALEKYLDHGGASRVDPPTIEPRTLQDDECFLQELKELKFQLETEVERLKFVLPVYGIAGHRASITKRDDAVQELQDKEQMIAKLAVEIDVRAPCFRACFFPRRAIDDTVSISRAQQLDEQCHDKRMDFLKRASVHQSPGYVLEDIGSGETPEKNRLFACGLFQDSCCTVGEPE